MAAAGTALILLTLVAAIAWPADALGAEPVTTVTGSVRIARFDTPLSNVEVAVADGIAWVVLFVVPVVGIGAFWMVHLLPEKIAEKRKHPQAKAIQVLFQDDGRVPIQQLVFPEPIADATPQREHIVAGAGAGAQPGREFPKEVAAKLMKQF